MSSGLENRGGHRSFPFFHREGLGREGAYHERQDNVRERQGPENRVDRKRLEGRDQTRCDDRGRGHAPNRQPANIDEPSLGRALRDGVGTGEEGSNGRLF